MKKIEAGSKRLSQKGYGELEVITACEKCYLLLEENHQ